jgi:hypothetical protein
MMNGNEFKTMDDIARSLDVWKLIGSHLNISGSKSVATKTIQLFGAKYVPIYERLQDELVAESVSHLKR